MKFFISCPIADKEYNDILMERNNATFHLIELFPDCNIEVIDSFIPEMYYDKNNNPIMGIGTCIGLMGDADYVYMCQGWEESRGCRIEHMVAQEYEIPIIYEE